MKKLEEAIINVTKMLVHRMMLEMIELEIMTFVEIYVSKDMSLPVVMDSVMLNGVEWKKIIYEGDLKQMGSTTRMLSKWILI